MIQLIGEKTLKSKGLLNGSLDPAYILPAVQLAQDVKLQQVLGSRLYKKLCFLAENNLLGVRVPIGKASDSVNDVYFVMDESGKASVGNHIFEDDECTKVVGTIISVSYPEGANGEVVANLENGESGVSYTQSDFLPVERLDTMDYKRLLDGDVKNYLVYQTMAEIQPMLFAKFRNAGMVNSQDTQMQQVGLSDINYLTTYYQDKADFYANRLTIYLCHNTNIYPEYSHSFANGEIGANCTDYTCPIEL